MNLEKKINLILLNNPKIKKIIKRLYQFFFYIISDKKEIESTLKIQKVNKNDEFEYFFGYYDKSPWDINNKYILAHKIKPIVKNVAPHYQADIILIEEKKKKTVKISSTNSWNIQQGSMLQWLGPDFNKEIIHNDFRNGSFCSVIININDNTEQIINSPIYSVSSDGKFALTLDFERLHYLRPGYGYSNIQIQQKLIDIPVVAIKKVDLIENKTSNLLYFSSFVGKENKGEKHKVNHIMISPNNKNFIFLHRYFINNKKQTELILSDMNSNVKLLHKGMISHCNWMSDTEIIAYCLFENKLGYYSINIENGSIKLINENIQYGDGHPSFLKETRKILTDTYADKSRKARLILFDEKKHLVLAKIFIPFKYDNDFRCDLHPRLSRNERKICFDSTHEGKRALYVINLNGKS